MPLFVVVERYVTRHLALLPRALPLAAPACLPAAALPRLARALPPALTALPYACLPPPALLTRLLLPRT